MQLFKIKSIKLIMLKLCTKDINNHIILLK